MSPLTKIFVVLLVVLSLLQTAAVVVYVNKEDFNRTTLNQTVESLRARETELEQSRQALTAAQQQLTQVTQESQTRGTQATEQINNAQRDVANLNVQLAKAASANAAQEIAISRLTEGLKTSQDTTSRLNAEVMRLRTGNDQLVRQTSELNSTVSDLSNKLDVTERERKFLAEQLTEAQTQNQRLSLQLKNMGVKPGQAVVAGAAVNRAGPPIAGRVSEVKMIADMPYATISVGSADQVAPGMEFKVISKTNDYLGSLVVSDVTPNQAYGKLSGPRIREIKPGVEVRTQ